MMTEETQAREPGKKPLDPRTLDPEVVWCELNAAMRRLTERTDEVVALEGQLQGLGRTMAREIEARDAEIARLQALLSEFETAPVEGSDSPDALDQT